MRRQHRPYRNVHSQARQFDLFGPPQAAGGGSAPTWNTLPEGTRRTLTSLMARLLVEYDAVAHRLHSAGGRPDV
jgi:hypothetical protein